MTHFVQLKQKIVSNDDAKFQVEIQFTNNVASVTVNQIDYHDEYKTNQSKASIVSLLPHRAIHFLKTFSRRLISHF